ncbi:hypothetical protein P3T25_000482 [Paraburkholderia sp. GAS32]
MPLRQASQPARQAIPRATKPEKYRADLRVNPHNNPRANRPVPRKIAGKHQEAKSVAVTGWHGRLVSTSAGSTRYQPTCTSIRSHHRAVNA